MRVIRYTKNPKLRKKNLLSRSRKTDLPEYISSHVDRILYLQKTVGNRAIMKMFHSGRIKNVSNQREKEEEGEVNRLSKEISCRTADVAPKVKTYINTIKGVGRPLPKTARTFFESRFGHNFSQVRVHVDERAAESARSLNAQAFTVKRDIVFGTGQFEPETVSGKKLLAHELTHVVQQKVGRYTIQRSVVLTEDDYKSLAEQIYKAMAGPGTDEESIFAALQRLEKDAAAISNLLKIYKDIYKQDLETEIRSEMSGEELRLALDLIGIKAKPKKGEMVGKVPGTADEYKAAAKKLYAAMKGLGTDEEAIYATLIPFGRDAAKRKKLKEIYRSELSGGLTGKGLVEDIKSEMSGNELLYALYLLNAPTKVLARSKLSKREYERFRKLSLTKRKKEARKLVSPGGSQSGRGGWLEYNYKNLQKFAKYFSSVMPTGLSPYDLTVLSSVMTKVNPEYRELPPVDLWPNMKRTLELLRDLGNESDTRFTILSAYRSDIVNALSGGAKESAHMDFYGLDVKPLGDQAKFEAYVKHYWQQKGKDRNLGLGFYRRGRVHIDAKNYRRWPKNNKWKKEGKRKSFKRYKKYFKLPLHEIRQPWEIALQGHWKGTFNQGRKTFSIHLVLKVTENSVSGEYGYNDGKSIWVTGIVRNGKVSYLTTRSGSVMGAIIKFDWKEGTFGGKGVLKSRKGFLKLKAKKGFIGSWGENGSTKNRGKLNFF